MLSRLQCRAGLQGLLKCAGQFQIPAASATSNSAPAPTETSLQRDLVNFPRPQRLENTPETVFGFVPKSWFDFLYPKTGVTGPYMLLFGGCTYLFSKEWLVINAEYYEALAFVIAIVIIQKKFGPKIKEYISAEQQKAWADLDAEQILMKKSIAEQISSNEKYVGDMEVVASYLPQAKRENVYLQMEAEYRSRLQEAYTKVKRHLDYHVQRQAVEKQLRQKNLSDWVIRNVEQSITPQLKKNSLKQCIADLKALAASP